MFLVVVVAQAYAVNVMEEYVLRGNSAILKCHIPSFVSDFVYVSSWLTEEAGEKTEIFPSAKDYGTEDLKRTRPILETNQATFSARSSQPAPDFDPDILGHCVTVVHRFCHIFKICSGLLVI